MLDEEDYRQRIADVFVAVEEHLPLTKLHSASNKQQMCQNDKKLNYCTVYSSAHHLKSLLILLFLGCTMLTTTLWKNFHPHLWCEHSFQWLMTLLHSTTMSHDVSMIFLANHTLTQLHLSIFLSLLSILRYILNFPKAFSYYQPSLVQFLSSTGLCQLPPLTLATYIFVLIFHSFNNMTKVTDTMAHIYITFVMAPLSFLLNNT